MTIPGILGAGAAVALISGAITQAAVATTTGSSEIALPVSLIVASVTGILAIGGMFATVRLHKAWTDDKIGAVKTEVTAVEHRVGARITEVKHDLSEKIASVATENRESNEEIQRDVLAVRTMIEETVAARRKYDYVPPDAGALLPATRPRRKKRGR